MNGPRRRNGCGRSWRATAVAAVAAGGVLSACSGMEDALTSHARPAATAAGVRLPAEALARVMAESPIPDTMLTEQTAAQLARLWADYVILAEIYRAPDSVLALDYEPLLQDGMHYDALAVSRLRDRIVATADEIDLEDLRAWYEERQPFTRLDLRRIRLEVPGDASEAARDSVYAEAVALRDRLAGGADFVETARTESDDPGPMRGRLATLQGHEHVPPVADTVLFHLQPGEVSPVFSTDEGMLIYKIEGRREPAFDDRAAETARRLMVGEREAALQKVMVDSLLDAARRTVPDGAATGAMRIAREADMARGDVRGSATLVRWEGGEITADDLRRLLRVRPDLRRRFVAAEEEDAANFLLELAADRVLIEAARAQGLGPSEDDRRQLREAVAAQMARIASRYELSREFIDAPGFEIGAASTSFLFRVLNARQPVPWLSEYRPMLMEDYPSEVFEAGAGAAARLARDLREAAARSDDGTADGPEAGPADESPGEPDTEDHAAEEPAAEEPAAAAEGEAP
ncbi:MAG: peptidylprolyl isomerase [Gemmatimonadota bacterium]|nr:peptidylprolyl isomerase [Gemmatimonadota bacterium]